MEANFKPSIGDKNSALYEWVSPSRPYKKRSKEFFKTAGALIFLVVVILIFAGEFLLIGAILATFLVVYALSTVPPEDIKHAVTPLGIETAGFFHRWEELNDFWLDEKNDQKMVVIRTVLNFPTHLYLLLGTASFDKVKQLLSEQLPFREQPERTILDRAAKWLSQKIPLERAS